MTTIVTRAGKGTPLTNTEVDSNFTNLNSDKLELGGTFSSGTANAVLYLNASKVLTTGSALTFDGTALAPDNTTRTLGTSSLRWGTVFATSFADGTDQFIGSSGTTVLVGYGASWTAQSFAIGGSEQMRLTSTGLGIGTSSPGTKLVVTGAGNITSTISSSSGFAQLSLSGSSGQSSFITYTTTGGGGLGFFDATASAERLRIDSSGNLGLGVTPSAWGSSKALQISSTVIYNNTADDSFFGSNYYFDGSVNKYINTAEAAAYGQVDGSHRWFTAPSGTAGNAITFTQAMTLDASGNLVIGGTSANVGVWNNAITLNTASGNAAYELTVAGTAKGFLAADASNVYLQSSGAIPLIFTTNGSERARIDSSGLFLVGRTSPQNNGTIEALGTSRQAFVGQVTDNNNSTFQGFSSGGVATFQVTGAGDLQLRRDDSGPTLNLVNADMAANERIGQIRFSSNGVTGQSSVIDAYGGAGSVDFTDLRFSTANGGVVGERARITSGGELLVGKTAVSATSGVGVQLEPGGGVVSVRAGSTDSDITWLVYSTGAAANRFYVGMAGTVFATNTTISAISDQRLKENIQDLDVGLDKIMALKPRKFDWKAGKGKDIKGDRGWIAQEFEQVFPDMIDTWKDEAPEGEAPYKSVRADLIPVLVKAVQEQQAIIESLKARLDAANL
jgi:hypothetical protein